VDLDAVVEAFLAGNVATIGFTPIEFTAPNALIVANRHRKGIDAVDEFVIHLFPALAKPPTYTTNAAARELLPMM
jgi:hypothetical protein